MIGAIKMVNYLMHIMSCAVMPRAGTVVSYASRPKESTLGIL